MSWLTMPFAVLQAYIRNMKDLRGESYMADAVSATFPHMDKKDRNKLVKEWVGVTDVARNLSQEERHARMAAVGITVER